MSVFIGKQITMDAQGRTIIRRNILNGVAESEEIIENGNSQIINNSNPQHTQVIQQHVKAHDETMKAHDEAMKRHAEAMDRHHRALRASMPFL